MWSYISFAAGLASAALLFTYFGGGVKAASSVTASHVTDTGRVAVLEQKVRNIESLMAAREMPGNTPEHVSLESRDRFMIEGGKRVLIDAGDEISFTTGAASLILKKDGKITLKGKGIAIVGDTVNVNALADAKVKGSKIEGN